MCALPLLLHHFFMDAPHLRSPLGQDASAMQSIARESGTLSVNDTYYYALMARHFAPTCLVAERDGRVCGYVTGYQIPEQQNTLFIWQVGVAEASQGRGLGKIMLCTLIDRNRAEFLEATITPDNHASLKLFKAIARQYGVKWHFSAAEFFSRSDLGPDEKVEHLMRIGPI